MAELKIKDVEFVGVTGNQAQAIESVLQLLKNELLAGKELAFKKTNEQLEKLNSEYELFKQSDSWLKNNAPRQLKEVLKEQLKKYEETIEKVKENIENIEKDIEYVNEYIASVRSKIKETHLEDKVIYEYDKQFFEIWLGLPLILFNFEIKEE